MPPPPHFMDDAQPSGKPREYRKLLKSFCKYYRNHLPYLYIGLASMIVSTVVTMFIPLLTYRIFDTYLKNEDISMVVWASAALLGMALVLAAAEFIGINWGHKLGIRMDYKLPGRHKRLQIDAHEFRKLLSITSKPGHVSAGTAPRLYPKAW